MTAPNLSISSEGFPMRNVACLEDAVAWLVHVETIRNIRNLPMSVLLVADIFGWRPEHLGLIVMERQRKKRTILAGHQ